MPETKPTAAQRTAATWVAVLDLTVERRDEESLRFAAGQECVGVPDSWPPAWLVEQGLVEPKKGSD